LRILSGDFPYSITAKGRVRMLSRRATGLLIAAPLVLLTACGDAERLSPNADVATAAAVDKPKATINPAPKETPTATATSAAASSPGQTATSAATDGAPAAGGNAVKGTPDNKFDPASLEVKVGTKVTWTLEGVHSVNGGTDGKPDPASPMQSQIGVPSYEVTFDKPGTYPYFCLPHFSLGMKGEIVVK
jgi:plastocyanin